MLTIVEKVLYLQGVDIFEHTSTENLAHIAAITQEVEFKADAVIYQTGQISDSMYIVIEGKVAHLVKGKDTHYNKNYFGSWALLDEEPRVATAQTIEDTRLLRIDREDFFELLADHVQITKSVLKTSAQRLRNLATVVGNRPKIRRTT